MSRKLLLLAVFAVGLLAGATAKGLPLSLNSPSYEQRAVQAFEKMASKLDSIDRSVSKCR